MEDPQSDWMQAMRRGDHAAAWAISDQVLAGRDPAGRDDPALPYHRRWVWDGTDPAGRDVLVRCYHGLGDTLQYARFLPVLARRAASVTLEAQPELTDLLAGSGLPLRLSAFQVSAPLPASSCDLEIMELSHALRCRPDAAPPPYLQAAPRASARGLTGICWRAGDWNPTRSVPPQALAAALPGRRLLALQTGPVPSGLDVVNPAGCPDRIEATASWIAGLDLVVTVDTMVAHLAGALGRPAWLMLKHDADWRWSEDGHRQSHWYPSLRLFRQAAPGDWGSVLSRIRREG